jgi:hypothetical protein
MATHTFSRRLIGAAACLLVATLALAQSPPSTRPTTRPATIGPGQRPPPPPNPIPDAAKVLLKEFEDSQGPNRTLPRRAADYFRDATEKPTPDQVFAALGRRWHNDTRADAYVKWQVLSALPTPVDQSLAGKLATYLQRGAPQPLPNPLLDPRKRSEIETAGSRLRPGQEGEIAEKLRTLADEHFDANRPIIGLRDDIIRRLPEGIGRFTFIWEEAGVRARLGVNVDAIRDNALKEIDIWMAGADARDLQALVQIMVRARSVESGEMPRSLRLDGQSLRWDRMRVRIEAWDNTVQASINRLNDRIRGPQR